MNNGKQNAQCGSGVWFDQGNTRNIALKVPGENQLNQIGEIAAVITTITAVAPYQPIRIMTDSKYIIDGLTTNLESWEDDRWINIKNAPMFKKAAHLMRQRSARTSFKWVKGHSRNLGNEGSNALAKRGVNKQHPDILDLRILIEFDIQGVKLSTLTQAKAYRGILERRQYEPRITTINHLQLTHEAIN